MTPVGRILILPKGRYDADTVYNMLDLVMHNGTSWLAKKTVVNIEPSEENVEFWQKLVDITESVAVQIEDKIKEYFLAPDYITPIQNGGTGGNSLEEARTNLGFPPDYITSVKNGGTGANTVDEALANLGLSNVAKIQKGTYKGNGTANFTLGFDFLPRMIIISDEKSYLILVYGTQVAIRFLRKSELGSDMKYYYHTEISNFYYSEIDWSVEGSVSVNCPNESLADYYNHLDSNYDYFTIG